MNFGSVVLDSNNAEVLSEFYKNMLGWNKKVYDNGEDGKWIVVYNKEESTIRLTFQQVDAMLSLFGLLKWGNNNKCVI